jgi:hypothetical protein
MTTKPLDEKMSFSLTVCLLPLTTTTIHGERGVGFNTPEKQY